MPNKVQLDQDYPTITESQKLYARAKGLSVDSLPPYKSNWGDPIP